MKKRKRDEGITLLALVVTVIVLIILAAITINLLLGENGIIKRTREGASNWLLAAKDEEDILSDIEEEIKEMLTSEEDMDLGNLYPEIPEEDWIPIYTREQLAKIGSGETIIIEEKQYIFNPDANYVLKSSIDLTGEDWTPISIEFKGLFVGNNKRISNLTINITGRYVGLFSISSGTITNLRMTNININNRYDVNDEPAYTGAIVGRNNNGTITNCYCTGKMKVNGDNFIDTGSGYSWDSTGGLVGYNSNRYYRKML